MATSGTSRVITSILVSFLNPPVCHLVSLCWILLGVKLFTCVLVYTAVTLLLCVVVLQD